MRSGVLCWILIVGAALALPYHLPVFCANTTEYSLPMMVGYQDVLFMGTVHPLNDYEFQSPPTVLGKRHPLVGGGFMWYASVGKDEFTMTDDEAAVYVSITNCAKRVYPFQ